MKRIILLFVFPILFSCSSVDVKNSENELKGYYSYFADAALFYDCKTDKKYPIAFEGDNIALEKAYLEINQNPGEKIIVTLIGKYELRDKTDSSGKEEFLIVSKFLDILPNIDCNRNIGTANLLNTFWKLNELNEKSANNIQSEKEIHLIIDSDNKIKGFAGCNSFFGTIATTNDSIKFNQIGATRKMCVDNMELEEELFTTFQNTIRYKIYGEFLYLYDANGIIAKFESVYFD